MSRTRTSLFACALSSLLAGCLDNTPEPELIDCGMGTALVWEDEQLCVFTGPIVIETGFLCPGSMSRRITEPDFIVCGPAKDRTFFTPTQTSWVREQLRGRGFPVMPPVRIAPERMLPARPDSPASKLDVLMVLDNSGSMCEEFAALREGFPALLERLINAPLDLHIGITTTHVPPMNFPGSVEPVSIPFQLQSTPQPVPGSAVECTGNLANGFAPLRATLEVALSCLADPAERVRFEGWTDLQINCALGRQTMGCPNVQSMPSIDTNRDGVFELFDLFPSSSLYRPLLKVLRTSAYRGPDGQVDAARLSADFACMSLVGGRGYGIEKGLRAAIDAVSPALTGLAQGLNQPPPSAALGFGEEALVYNPDAPNHGLIRPDAATMLFFMTDENDCSDNDGALDIFADACGERSCDFYNSLMVPEEASPLLSPGAARAAFVRNLSMTKGRAISDAELLVASFHGDWDRLEEPLPQCTAGEVEQASVACSSATLGSAFSGDRYERFMRGFANFYPNEAIREAMRDGLLLSPQDTRFRQDGVICDADLSSRFERLGEVAAQFAR